MLSEHEIRAGERACVVEGLTVKQRATSRSNARVVRLTPTDFDGWTKIGGIGLEKMARFFLPR